MHNLCLQSCLADPWVSLIQNLSKQPSLNLGKWLHKPFVLSAAFRQVAHHFHVTLKSQGFGSPREDERQRLSTYTHENLNRVLVREVCLKDGDKLLGLGRVVIPEVTYHHFKDSIEKIGANPFGETFLYSQPECERGPFEYSIFKPDKDGHYWGRRSLFCIKGLPLLITEVLMNDLPTYPVAHYDEASLPCL